MQAGSHLKPPLQPLQLAEPSVSNLTLVHSLTSPSILQSRLKRSSSLQNGQVLNVGEHAVPGTLRKCAAADGTPRQSIVATRQSHGGPMVRMQACTHSFMSFGVQSQGTWADGPEDGGIARTHAARLLAELASQPGMHSLLVQSQAANAIAESVAAMVWFLPAAMLQGWWWGCAAVCLGRHPSHSACVSSV